VKYSDELKLKIVNDYLLGRGGYVALAKKYGIKSKTTVRDWVKTYNDFGFEGIKTKKESEFYPVQVKLDAVKLLLIGNHSKREIATQFGITDITLLSRWKREYLTEGIDGLTNKTRRHSINMAKKINKKPLDEKDQRIAELEEKLKYVELENRFLKELRKLALKKKQSKPKN